MFSKRFLITALVGLLVIAVLAGMVSSAQRDAWTQGYMMGRLSTGSDGGAMLPYMPYGYPGAPLVGTSMGGGLGLIIPIGLLLLFFLFVGRSFRSRAWAMHGGPKGAADRPWKHMSQPEGEQGVWPWHRPPWCWGQEDEPEPGRTEAETGHTEATP